MPEENKDLSQAKELVSDYLTVLDAHILRESPQWITAVITVETPNESRSLRLYRWRNDEGEWKKDSGFNINRESDWQEIKKSADEIIEGLWGVDEA
ncbi:hypothetical protein AKJ39_01295 [candidate division MSBL1 archaeon SCGC-AAA259J03]|uniref:Uncharacterized protein n=1 Tax=candidate division MSBL1 archaeon SCGC-AAA259J03 TaxID=1698269 RepID=A0A656Z090_9EURY|nr:hypothetical protein AKJ39_01295 [candidate division MSBL1 archaeon SCGC-AAA259J03]